MLLLPLGRGVAVRVQLKVVPCVRRHILHQLLRARRELHERHLVLGQVVEVEERDVHLRGVHARPALVAAALGEQPVVEGGDRVRQVARVRNAVQEHLVPMLQLQAEGVDVAGAAAVQRVEVVVVRAKHLVRDGIEDHATVAEAGAVTIADNGGGQPLRCILAPARLARQPGQGPSVLIGGPAQH
eukprot:scaffold13102_cov55-Phaeocystis_antarctica.AAC.2